jgi:hypothetical protein
MWYLPIDKCTSRDIEISARFCYADARKEHTHMNEKSRRREILQHYKHTMAEAGVYRIVNSKNGRALLGSTPNLQGIRNKLKFAQSTSMPGALDHRLRQDISQYGIDVFSMEVLEILETTPEMTPQDIRDDLDILEKLWREKLEGTTLLY